MFWKQTKLFINSHQCYPHNKHYKTLTCTCMSCFSSTEWISLKIWQKQRKDAWILIYFRMFSFWEYHNKSKSKSYGGSRFPYVLTFHPTIVLIKNNPKWLLTPNSLNFNVFSKYLRKKHLDQYGKKLKQSSL